MRVVIGAVPHASVEYDQLGRLTGMAHEGRLAGQGTRGYAYDTADNLLAKLVGTNRSSYRVDPYSNRILAEYQDGQIRRYSYNAAGSTTHVGTTEYTWDGLERLVRASEAGRPIAEYAYNAFGERIRKVTYSNNQKKVSYFFYDGAQLVAEAEPEQGAIVITKQYVWLEELGQSRPIAMLRSASSTGSTVAAAIGAVRSGLARTVGHTTADVFAIISDHTGAPRALVGKDSQVAWRADVTGYGEAFPDSAHPQLEFNLRGSNQYFDSETGLHYNQQRYLDVRSGRYLSVDPLGQAGGLNLYVFAGADPIANVDPLGLQSKPATSVANWSFAEKLEFVVKATLPKLPGDLADGLMSLVSPQNIATTAAIFALWAGSHAFGVGFLADGIMLGLAYYQLGKAAADLIVGLVEAALAINDAQCENDLDKAASTLSKAVGVGTTALVSGLLLRKVFSRTEGDLGAKAIDELKRGINYARNAIVSSAPKWQKLGFRLKSWARLTYGKDYEVGLVGELEMASILMSGKQKLVPLGPKTVDPTTIRTAADYNSVLAGTKGTKGVDGTFAERLGIFQRLIGKKLEVTFTESKATRLEYPANPTPAFLRSLLTVKNGVRQLSSEWLRANSDKRIKDSVGAGNYPSVMEAWSAGRVKRLLVLTDKNGTRIFEVFPHPKDAREVIIGNEVTNLYH